MSPREFTPRRTVTVAGTPQTEEARMEARLRAEVEEFTRGKRKKSGPRPDGYRRGVPL